ncbi:DUF2470 domain-containing protein, partial [Oligoflexia bacterium]|nr:DUF2470 domain-containing protein [Oligoflexia bacterium]
MPADLSEQVKRFISFGRNATLCSFSKSQAGYPFGSIVPFDIDAQGRMTIFVAGISEHFRNLSADARASLFVRDNFAIYNPRPYARVCIVGNFERVDDDEQLQECYWKRFPNAVHESIAHTFVYFRLIPIQVRWIGGFGDAKWLKQKDFCEARFDPIAYAGMPIAEHMNVDHADSLVELWRNYSDQESTPKAVTMTYIDCDGFELSARDDGEQIRCRVEFPEKPTQADDVRRIIVAMVKQD